MKRIILIFAIASLVSGELTAQQQSSRRTRQIQPPPSSPAESAAEQLKRQAEQVAAESTPAATSPFQEYAAPATDGSGDAGIRVAANGEFKPNVVAPARQTEAKVKTEKTEVTVPAQLAQPNQMRPDGSSSDVAVRKTNDNVIESGKAISTRIVASSEINVGQPASLTLIARNESAEDLAGVALTVQLSDHVEFLKADPQPTDRSETIAIWQLPSMKAGQESEIMLQVVPYTKQAMEIETQFAIVDTNRVSIAVRQPDVKMTVNSADKAIAGQAITHQIKIWNEGDGTADRLRIDLGMSSDMKLIDAEGNTVEVGSLKPGETRELTLQTTTGQAGESPFVYQLAGPGVDIEEISRINIVVPELYAEILGPKVNIPGREGSYTINVNNPCEVDITDTRIVLQIPKGMEVTLLSRSGDFDAKTGTIAWDLATMTPGVTESIQFKAKLLGNENQQCQVVVNSRETTSNQLAFETRAYVHTELKLAMKNVTGAVNVGDSAEFLVVASNTGHAAAEGVAIEIEIPEWVTPEDDDAYQFDRERSRLVFNPVNVPEGMAAKFKFKGTCTTAGNFVVRGMLTHSGQSQPMISDTSLFVLDSQTEKVGSVITPNKEIR